MMFLTKRSLIVEGRMPNQQPLHTLVVSPPRKVKSLRTVVQKVEVEYSPELLD